MIVHIVQCSLNIVNILLKSKFLSTPQYNFVVFSTCCNVALFIIISLFRLLRCQAEDARGVVGVFVVIHPMGEGDFETV